MKYIVIGEAKDVQQIIGEFDELSAATLKAKLTIFSGEKLWDLKKSEMVIITGATIYERIAEAIVNVDIKVIGKAEAVPA